MPTPTPVPSSARELLSVEVPRSQAVVPRLLPVLRRALDGGPALLPVPSGPATVRQQVLSAARPDLPLEDNATALVVPTSGSSGTPKAVILGAGALRASAAATSQRLGGPGTWVLALPATHIAGLMVLVRSILDDTAPVAVDLADGFDPESFAAASVRAFARSDARRYTSLVPRQLAALMDAGGVAASALTGYDAVLVGGAAAPDALLDRARRAGVRVVTTYGMTETCGGCVYDGRALDGVRVGVGDDRRIRLGGPTLASGYRLDPELTSHAFENGWFLTADAGRLDDDAVLSVLGRVDDVAVSGGVNVPLAAVDGLVAAHPAVREAMAVALPDETWGQRVVVAVVPRDPTAPPTLDSLRAHLTRHAPVAYAPKELVVVDSLPTLPGGKADRRALADRLSGSPEATSH